MAAIVKQIDHILTVHADPAALFMRLTETLGLPVVWPLRNFGTFVSGGVFFGNVDVEILGLNPMFPSAALCGIAFEPPSLETALDELRRRGIATGEPQPFAGTLPSGEPGVLWTNVGLPTIAASGQHFICARASYGAERRAWLRTAFDGGKFGIVGVREVVVGAQDSKQARAVWSTLLAPAPMIAPDVWQLGDSPAIRLVTHAADVLLKLVIEVKSLGWAREFLSDGLLGDVNIQLVEGEGSTW